MAAQTAQGKKKSGKADWTLNHIQKLYRIEHQIKENTLAERYQIRQDKSVPQPKKLEAWLIKSEQQVLPKKELGEAITYCLIQWDKLQRYTLDGRPNITEKIGYLVRPLSAQMPVRSYIVSSKQLKQMDLFPSIILCISKKNLSKWMAM